MSFVLSAGGLKKVEDIILRYPSRPAALLPVLNLIQREKGYVSSEAEAWAAEALGMPRIRVSEAVSFYSLLRRRPAGEYVIQVCRNISCSLAGADGLLRHLEARLGIREGETTPDGRFTLAAVECLGLCDRAPCLMVNDEDHGPITIEAADELLRKLAGDGG
jgi:NADH-quinone oxidoreductase subunit E